MTNKTRSGIMTRKTATNSIRFLAVSRMYLQSFFTFATLLFTPKKGTK